MPLGYDKLIKTRFESRQAYTRKDTILYALGAGVGQQDPVDRNERRHHAVGRPCVRCMDWERTVWRAGC